MRHAVGFPGGFMIEVSVMYPNNPGARFDHTYYRDKHMPMVKARMADIPNYTDLQPVLQISEVVVG
jgi:hypothetical protein